MTQIPPRTWISGLGSARNVRFLSIVGLLFLVAWPPVMAEYDLPLLVGTLMWLGVFLVLVRFLVLPKFLPISPGP